MKDYFVGLAIVLVIAFAFSNLRVEPIETANAESAPSSSTNARYKLIEATGKDNLAESVSKYLDGGWETAGGVTVDRYGRVYTQAIIKK